MGRVVVLGSLNADLVTAVDRHPAPGETVRGRGLRRLAGGKGANQAVAAAAAGAEVVLVGAVGDDEAGRAYLQRLRERGIGTDHLVVRPGQATGTALIVVDEAGENTIVVVPGANATVGDEALAALADLGPGDVLLVQLEVPLATVAEACRRASAAGARVVLNLAPYDELPADVVALADPVVVNEHEAALLRESGLTAASLVVTLGAAGATWGDLVLEPPALAELGEVVDTTGAGDSFCGALAAALVLEDASSRGREADVSGAGREPALRAALAAGAASVRSHGAQPEPDLSRSGSG